MRMRNKMLLLGFRLSSFSFLSLLILSQLDKEVVRGEEIDQGGGQEKDQLSPLLDVRSLIPSSLSVDAITSTSLWLSWKLKGVPKGGEINGYRISYLPHGENRNPDVKTINTGLTAAKYELKELGEKNMYVPQSDINILHQTRQMMQISLSLHISLCEFVAKRRPSVPVCLCLDRGRCV